MLEFPGKEEKTLLTRPASLEIRRLPDLPTLASNVCLHRLYVRPATIFVGHRKDNQVRVNTSAIVMRIKLPQCEVQRKFSTSIKSLAASSIREYSNHLPSGETESPPSQVAGGLSNV